MERQRAAREALIAGGANHRGWKVGLTTPLARAAAGIDSSVVGFLTDRTELTSGAEVAIADWTKPMIEAELAIEICADIDPEADVPSAQTAIGGLAVAIEIVDLTVPMAQVEELLAIDIFHRHFVVGPQSNARAGGDATGITVQAWLDGESVAMEEDPCAVIGAPTDTVRLVARELAQIGLSLSSGDVILAGSTIPMTADSPGQRLRVEATTLGALDLTFARAPAVK